jgi:hypothetical protein
MGKGRKEKKRMMQKEGPIGSIKVAHALLALVLIKTFSGCPWSCFCPWTNPAFFVLLSF